MKTPLLRGGLLLAATIAVSSLVSYGVSAQAPARRDQGAASSTPRLPDGRPDLNGTWVFTVETDQGGGTPTITLKVEGEKVTGHISATTFERDFTGTLKGQALEFSFSRDFGAVIYKGTAESSDAIKGTVDFASGAVTGTFTAKRKPA